MEKEKLVKTAKALDTVFKVLEKIILICAVACVVVVGIITVINVVDPNTAIGTDFSVDIGPLTFELTEEAVPDNNAVLINTWIMVATAVVIAAAGCYAFRIIRKILAPMTQGNPFHPTVGKEIRKLAFASLAIGILLNIISAAEVFNAFHTFNLNALLQNSQIQSISADYGFDISFVVGFFVLLLMSYIFHYGEELQKLSDETL